MPERGDDASIAEPSGLRRERILGSPRFYKGRFRNTERVRTLTDPSKALSVAGEFVFGRGRRTPAHPLPVENPLEAWSRPVASGLRVTWLGHSTTLLEIDGVRILTDPVWGKRASPSSWVGPRRFHPPPAPLETLPPLDGVLVSHDHYDHLDRPTVRALARTGVVFYTSLGVGAHLEAWGVPPDRIVELDWWEEAEVAGGRLRLLATPSRHFSGRSLLDRDRTLWSSWVLRTERHAVFFSGDTGLTSELAAIGKREGPFDLVMLEVGAFHPAWGDIHLGPDNALIAHAMLRGRTLLPVHWGTFDLGLHVWDEPAEVLARRAPELGVAVITPRLGRAVEPAHVERIDPWWREVGALVDGSLPSTPSPALR